MWNDNARPNVADSFADMSSWTFAAGFRPEVIGENSGLLSVKPSLCQSSVQQQQAEQLHVASACTPFCYNETRQPPVPGSLHTEDLNAVFRLAESAPTAK